MSAVDLPIYLAWDGSQQADRLGQHALRLATRRPDRHLHVLTVQEGDHAQLLRRLEPLAAEARYLGVNLTPTVLPPAADLYETLVAAVPERALLLCGMRAAARSGTFLSGTLAERLLREGRHHVLALRLSPGSAGRAARRLLLPVAGRTPTTLLPVLPLLSAEVLRLDVLRVMEQGPLDRRDRLEARGQVYLDTFVSALGAVLAPAAPPIQRSVRVGRTWPAEVIAAATELESDLLLLGATDRLLANLTHTGGGLEEVLGRAPCDVAVWRRARSAGDAG